MPENPNDLVMGFHILLSLNPWSFTTTTPMMKQRKYLNTALDSMVAWLILQEDFSREYGSYICHNRTKFTATCFIVFVLRSYRIHIVAYMIIERTVEPEKQPLLANSSETTFISRQWP
jgi:hypothetical protein